jgi:hypothetical protein
MENFDEDTIWLALDYVRGNLTDAEMDTVEARMAADRAFFLLIHDLRKMQKAATVQDPEVSKRVQVAADAYFACEAEAEAEVEAQPDEEAPRRVRAAWPWWAAGAVAAILIFSVIFYSLRGESYVERYFQRAEREQSLGAASPELLRQGMSKYATRDYEGAIQDFATIADTAQQYNTANYYLANAYLELGNPEAALKPLLNLASIGDQKYLEPRRWLLGLIYLDLGEKQKGEAELRALYDDKTSNYKESEIREILHL